MSLLDDLLVFRENTYCSAQKSAAIQQEYQRRENFEWSGRLSVGSFKTWDCCPKKLVAEAQKTKTWPESLLFKFDVGHAIHEVYQRRAMNTPGLKMIKPYFLPEVNMKSRNSMGQYVDTTLREELEKSWPEIPVTYRDPDTGEVVIMGYIDEIEVHKNKPVVLDIKSINDDPLEFKLRFDEIIKEKVESHFIQTQFYGIMANIDNYFSPLKIEKTKILYISTKLLGEPESERELVRPIKDEHYTKFDLLAKESVNQIRAYKENKDQKCNYRYCGVHNV